MILATGSELLHKRNEHKNDGTSMRTRSRTNKADRAYARSSRSVSTAVFAPFTKFTTPWAGPLLEQFVDVAHGERTALRASGLKYCRSPIA